MLRRPAVHSIRMPWSVCPELPRALCAVLSSANAPGAAKKAPRPAEGAVPLPPVVSMFSFCRCCDGECEMWRGNFHVHSESRDPFFFQETMENPGETAGLRRLKRMGNQPHMAMVPCITTN